MSIKFSDIEDKVRKFSFDEVKLIMNAINKYGFESIAYFAPKDCYYIVFSDYIDNDSILPETLDYMNNNLYNRVWYVIKGKDFSDIIQPFDYNAHLYMVNIDSISADLNLDFCVCKDKSLYLSDVQNKLAKFDKNVDNLIDYFDQNNITLWVHNKGIINNVTFMIVVETVEYLLKYFDELNDISSYIELDVVYWEECYKTGVYVLPEKIAMNISGIKKVTKDIWSAYLMETRHAQDMRNILESILFNDII